MSLRSVRIRLRRFCQRLWSDFRTAVNVSWLALRDPSIGWPPKALGAVAALIGVLPLEWIPGIHPVLVLLSTLVLVPGALWLAWLVVSAEHKEMLTQRARALPLQWPFFVLIAAILTLAMGVDLTMDLLYPGQDAFSQVVDQWLEDVLGADSPLL